MESLTDLWLHSGHDPRHLYQGSPEEITTELKAWVQRRKAHNDTNMAASWNLFRGMDAIQQVANRPEEVRNGQFPAMMDEITAITATQMETLDRTRQLEKEKDRESLLAKFLLASLRSRNIRWPQMPCMEGRQADAGVCGFLGTVDRGFNAETELEILEDRARVTQWQNELRRRDAIRADDIANNPIPGVNTHPIGLVGARFKQVIAKDPTKTTMEALTDAADGIMDPGSLESIIGRNSTGSTNIPTHTGETNRATKEHNLTPDHAAVHTSNMHNTVNVAAGGNKPITEDSIIYVADALGTITTAIRPPTHVATIEPGNLHNAAASPSSINLDSTNNVAIPSTSAATEAGANHETLPGTQGQDEGSKISKAKKKREGRKRAKARAEEEEEAAANVGGSSAEKAR